MLDLEATEAGTSEPHRQLPVMESGEGVLPDLYAHWISDLVGTLPQPEPRATCSSCAMCSTAPEEPLPEYRFDPDVKCCTYTPTVPNFLVGAILQDPAMRASGGADSVRARIASRSSVTPLSIGMSGAYRMAYDRAQASRSFGRAPVLRCPHLSAEGGCEIWTHRNGVCATWFCRHTRGGTGHRYWKALEQLLRTLERELGVWCALQVGIETESIAASLEAEDGASAAANQLGNELVPARGATHYRSLWGQWVDREEEFYPLCAKSIRTLKTRDLLAVCGPVARVRRDAVIDAQNDLLSATLPEKLSVSPLRVVASSAEHVDISTYSPFDTVRISRRAFDALAMFDGRDTDEVLTAVGDDAASFGSSDIRRLVDYGVLIGADRRAIDGSIAPQARR